MLVMKFGGSSVANSARINAIAAIIAATKETKTIVVSAMGDTTDWLFEAGQAALGDQIDISKIVKLHKDTLRELQITEPRVESLLIELKNLVRGISLVKEISVNTGDYLASFGERLSARIVAAYLRSLNINAQAYDAWDLGFITNEQNYNHDLVIDAPNQIATNINKLLAENITPIITGYIAKNKKGAISTLGRGGSDLTATILGACLAAEEVQVWKDVDGILTADPKIIPNALEVAELSYEEACELAYFGTQVLHPRAIQPVLAKNVPVRVKNSYNPDHPGSVISVKPENRKSLVHLITSKRSVTLIDVVSSQMLGPHGYLSTLFQIFDRNKISVDLLASSDVSVSLTLNGEADLTEFLPALQEIAHVSVSSNKAIVSLIADVNKSSLILSETFATLEKADINVQMLSQGCSKVKFSLVVDDQQACRCVEVLHEHFFN